MNLRILGGLCAVVVPALAGAQAAPDTGKACFAARPVPECKTFWITEVGWYHRAFGSGSIQNVPAGVYARPELNGHLSWELGLMSNRSRGIAVGGTLLVGGGGGSWRFGLNGRYRRWLGERSSIDVSAGPLGVVTHAPYSQPHRAAYGMNAAVALGWRDWAAVTVSADAVRGGGHNATAVYTGVRLGSYPAIVATAAVAAYIGLLLALLSGEGT